MDNLILKNFGPGPEGLRAKALIGNTLLTALAGVYLIINAAVPEFHAPMSVAFGVITLVICLFGSVVLVWRLQKGMVILLFFLVFLGVALTLTCLWYLFSIVNGQACCGLKEDIDTVVWIVTSTICFDLTFVLLFSWTNDAQRAANAPYTRLPLADIAMATRPSAPPAAVTTIARLALPPPEPSSSGPHLCLRAIRKDGPSKREFCIGVDPAVQLGGLPERSSGRFHIPVRHPGAKVEAWTVGGDDIGSVIQVYEHEGLFYARNLRAGQPCKILTAERRKDEALEDPALWLGGLDSMKLSLGDWLCVDATLTFEVSQLHEEPHVQVDIEEDVEDSDIL